MRSAVVAFVLLAGCGRIQFQREVDDAGLDAGRDAGSDAGRDAGSDAGRDGGSDAGRDAGSDGGCTWTTFGPVTPITELDTAAREGGGTLSIDMLRIYFNRAPVGGSHDLYVASRSSTTQPFGMAMPISELNTTSNDAEVALSDDERTIYFHSSRAATPTVYTADRTSLATPFGAARCAITGCPMMFGPTVSSDGLTLITFGTGSAGSAALFESHRATTADSFAGPAELSALSAAGVDAGYPGLSHDGLALYYVRTGAPGSMGCDEIWVATRTDLASPFGSARAVSEVNSTGCDGDPSLSADGTTLILTSDRTGTVGLEDLWMTERTCVL